MLKIAKLRRRETC